MLKRIAPQLYGYVPHFKRLISEFDKGNDLILRGATAVILIHTPSESRFGCQDANLAYQNGSLMAESLGVAQFYTGFVCSAVEQRPEQAAGQNARHIREDTRRYGARHTGRSGLSELHRPQGYKCNQIVIHGFVSEFAAY